MTTDQLRNFDGETVRLSRTVLRGSLRAADNSAPLLRTESADPSADSRIEVPVPLAKLREERQIRVLHVDDDPDLGETVGMFLERIDEDLTVVTETSAVAALGHVREGDVDCIVSDYQMPNTDGLELLELVRDQHPDLPFILFTGKGSEEIASEAIAAGATDYMQKGTGTDTYEVLANRVKNAVEQYRTEQQFWSALSWYQRLVEQELTGVCIVQGGEFVYVNQKLAEILGYGQDELVGQPPSFVVAADQTDLLEQLGAPDGERADSFETDCPVVRADGESRTIEISGGTIEYDGDPAWICVVRELDDE
ncbi:response regulator [Halomicroarcula sp. GCM10025324]|uniref:response regulator n=1 Tax=Haloarcula TaxID=2237 RepID=UPI0023E8B68C|nr:response regulator [Halomicroarcula sp. ZS-22-S1]